MKTAQTIVFLLIVVLAALSPLTAEPLQWKVQADVNDTRAIHERGEVSAVVPVLAKNNKLASLSTAQCDATADNHIAAISATLENAKCNNTESACEQKCVLCSRAAIADNEVDAVLPMETCNRVEIAQWSIPKWGTGVCWGVTALGIAAISIVGFLGFMETRKDGPEELPSPRKGSQRPILGGKAAPGSQLDPERALQTNPTGTGSAGIPTLQSTQQTVIQPVTAAEPTEVHVRFSGAENRIAPYGSSGAVSEQRQQTIF